MQVEGVNGHQGVSMNEVALCLSAQGHRAAPPCHRPQLVCPDLRCQLGSGHYTKFSSRQPLTPGAHKKPRSAHLESQLGDGHDPQVSSAGQACQQEGGLAVRVAPEVVQRELRMTGGTSPGTVVDEADMRSVCVFPPHIELTPRPHSLPTLQLTQGASASSTPEAGNIRASRKCAPASSEPERGLRVRPSWRLMACGQSAGARGRSCGGNKFSLSIPAIPVQPARRDELHSPHPPAQQPDWPWR